MRFKVPEGAKVKYRHERWVSTDDKGEDTVIHPRGGTTYCTVILPDEREVKGRAECSAKDNYSKKIGRYISLGRALATLNKGEQT